MPLVWKKEACETSVQVQVGGAELRKEVEERKEGRLPLLMEPAKKAMEPELIFLEEHLERVYIWLLSTSSVLCYKWVQIFHPRDQQNRCEL